MIALRISSITRLLFFLLFARCAFAFDTPIMAGGNSVPDSGGTRYSQILGNAMGWSATNDTNSRSVVPVAGTLKNLYVKFDTAPGATKSWVFTIVKNGVDQSMTCTMANTATSCNDTSNTVSFSAGDTLSIKSVPSGTPTVPGAVNFGVVFSATNSDEGILLGSSRINTMSSGTTEYGYIGSSRVLDATLNLRDAPSPTNGVIDKLYVELNAAPTVGNGLTFEVWKNNASTGVTCSVTGAATTCSDLANSVSVSTGDTLAIRKTIHSGTPTNLIGRWGMRWKPTIAGEAIVLANQANSPNTAGAARYAPLGGGTNGWNTVESISTVILPGSFTAKKWAIQLNNAPGGTTPQYTFTFRKNTANATQAVTIAGASTSGSDLVNTDSLVATDLIAVHSISANTPASAVSKWGMVFLDPNAATPTPTPSPTATPTATPTPTPTPTPIALRLLSSTGVGK